MQLFQTLTEGGAHLELTPTTTSALATVPSEACAVVVGCSPPPRSGAVGTARSTSTRSGTQGFRHRASAVPSLVMARGHRIESVPELPLVIGDSAESVEKTSAAIDILKQVGAYPDVEKAKDSHGIRPEKGKMRNRRYISRKGPLIVYDMEVKAFRTFRVEVANVSAFLDRL
ncbi:hypothetical protein AAG906_008372 [Vitis piasezkii]